MNLQVTVDVRKVLVAVVAVMLTIALAILYFMAPSSLTFAGTNASMFTNIAIATVLMLLSVTDTSLIALQYRNGLRLVATIFLFEHIDSAACMLHTLVSGQSYQLPDSTAARGALRFSSGAILFCAALVLVFAYCIRSLPSFQQFLNGAIWKVPSLIAALMLVLAQIMVWAMTDACNPPSNITKFPVVSLVATALILGAGAIFDDRDALDYAFIHIIASFVLSPPIFGDIEDPNQSAFRRLWKSHSAFVCLASIILIVVALLRNTPQFHLDRVVSLRMAAQGVLFIVGLTGAICVYAKSPNGINGAQYNWVASFAWLVPLLGALHVAINWEIFRGLGLLLTFASLPSLGNLALYYASNSPGGGYLNAGLVMSYFATLLSPIVLLVLEFQCSVKPIHEYFVTDASGDEDKTSSRFLVSSAVLVYLAAANFSNGSGAAAFMYSTQLLGGIFLLLGHTWRLGDVHRILLIFVAIPTFTGTYWPLGSTTAATADGILSFVICGWFTMHYIYKHEDRAFLEMLCGEHCYERQEPFISAAAAAPSPPPTSSEYQRVPSGNLNEKSSLLAQGSYQSPSSVQAEPNKDPAAPYQAV